MALRLSKQTDADATLRHQVVFEKQSHNYNVTVTCNCRKRAGIGTMGEAVGLERSRELYNDPERHVEPFTEEDVARW